MPEASRGSATLLEEAPAKLNLTLHVVGRRADGYHLIESLVGFTALGDTLEAEQAAALSLTLDGPFAPTLGATASADNLVLRAAHALAEQVGGAPGARLALVKRLPVASGIGGGSTDAAAAFRLLRRLWSIDMSDEALGALGLALGADLPVCIARRPAFMTGIGEQLTPVAALPPVPVVLVNPGLPLPTPPVYRAFAARGSLRTAPAPRPLGPWPDAAALIGALTPATNDLEAAAQGLCPPIGDVLAALRATGAGLARMSGSGATCFGLYVTADEAADAAARLRRAEPGWWVEATRLLS